MAREADLPVACKLPSSNVFFSEKQLSIDDDLVSQTNRFLLGVFLNIYPTLTFLGTLTLCDFSIETFVSLTSGRYITYKRKIHYIANFSVNCMKP